MTMQKSCRSENTPVNQGPTTKKHTAKAENATSIRKQQEVRKDNKAENAIRKRNHKSKNTSLNQKDNHRSENAMAEHIKDRFKYEVNAFYHAFWGKSQNKMWRIKLKFTIKNKIKVTWKYHEKIKSKCHEKSWPFETIRTRSPGINKVFLF